MEKGLARFRVSLLCFCCGCFVAAVLLRLLCCVVLLRCFVALRWQTAAGGPSHFVGPFPFREPMPPATVCHLSAAGTPTASWHGDHAHKYSRGILAWRRGHLSTLWHGDPQQNTPVVGARGKTVWNRCQTGLLPMLRLDFGTAPLPTGTSEPSSRGEAVIYWLFVHKMPLFHGH